MKQRTRKAFTWLVAICLLIGMVPVATMATEQTATNAVNFKAQQLTLSDDLTMKFYISLDDTITQSAIASVTVAGESTTYSIAELEPDADGYYVIPVPLAAAQMTEKIALQVIDGETVLGEKTYSVQDYAHVLLSGKYSGETENMVKQMLHYGAMAQRYFGYRQNDLANAGYELQTGELCVVPDNAAEMSVTDHVSGISFYGTSLVFQNRIAVRHYFLADKDIGTFTFRVGEKTYLPVSANGLYYIEIPEISPQNMDKTVELSVSDGDNTMTVGYSPVQYIVRMYQKTDDEKLKELLQAIYGYHLAAKNFTGVNGDFDNGIDMSRYLTLQTVLENDFSEDADKGVTQAWHKSAFYDSTATLENGWVRLTSTEHLFVYGGHTWGSYGGVSFEKGNTYRMSFDLMQGDESCTDVFALYVMKEINDPRYGDPIKTLKINFADMERMEIENTDNFASVSFDHQTGIAHIEAVFVTDSAVNTQVVSRSVGTNNWLLDNLLIEKVTENVDFTNGISHDDYVAASTLSQNDFSEKADNDGGRTAFFGSTATLEDGWLRVTSSEHIFTYGGHAWGAFGGTILEKGEVYLTSFDLKLGASDANRIFTVYIMTENGNDPRFGDTVKTLTLNFADFRNFVTENTDDFASVTYDAATQTAHIALLYTTDSNVYTDVVAKCSGTNNWLIDNMSFEKMMPNVDYSNGVSYDSFEAETVKFDNDFSENADKGVTQAWHKSAFYGSTATLEGGWVRLTSTEHIFVYGAHTWGYYGGVSFEKGATYLASFDLKLGNTDANRIFNLYVMNENGDPRYGSVVKTLTLNFADLSTLVTENTDDFAAVTYSAKTRTAHIEVVFTTDETVNTNLVAKSAGTNNWLLDNICFTKGGVAKSFDNGISFDSYTAESTLLENDFSQDVNKGVTQAWHKSAFYGSTATLEDGWARLTSSEHLFVFGGHTYGNYGGISFTMGTSYKVCFDLKLGDTTSNKRFDLYVMTENGDPRFGTVCNTLSLDFEDIDHFVIENTDQFASVTYNGKTGIAHIEILFTADSTLKTQIVSRNSGNNNWLLDNIVFQSVSTISNPLVNEGALLKSFEYGDVSLQDGLYKQVFDSCLAYYGQLSADDILYRWRKVSGMDTKTGRDLGWESGTTNPECCIAQLISAKARYYAVTGEATDLQVVKDILNGYQEIIDKTGTYPLMYHAYFYEKTLCALLDCYEYCSLEQGYEMAKAFVIYGMNTEKFAAPEKKLGNNNTEWYTMGEVLYRFAELADQKGESSAFVSQCESFASLYLYQDFWDIFYYGKNLFDYSVSVDNAYNQWFHAYSHLNSYNSAMQAYLYTQDAYYLDATKLFYSWMENSQKLVTGGYGVSHEWLLPRDEMVELLRTSSSSTETQCNAYAVVKLDSQLLSTTGNGAYGQWTEDAFYNMTIASLETSDGCPHYYSDYSSDGGSKYLRTDWPWACCAGTRPLVVMEYLKNIYFHDTQNLYVNLYTNSSVSFTNASGVSVTVSQSSCYPVEDTVSFTVNTSSDDAFAICFRKPQWLAGNAEVTVNGEKVGYAVNNGWIIVRRIWKNDDKVSLTLPMELSYSVISKQTDTSDCVYAVTFGPVTLACTGNNSTLAKYLPVDGDLSSLVTRKKGTLEFTVNAFSALTLKPYYAYTQGESYTLYISSKY